MMPQRGFLMSYQPYCMIVDVDLEPQWDYNAKIVEDSKKKFIFFTDGPFKINAYQKYLNVHGDADIINYFKELKFYSMNGRILTKNNIYAFGTPELSLTEINLDREVHEGYVKFLIDDASAEQISKFALIYGTVNKDHLDPSYDIKVHNLQNKSQDLFSLKGYDYLLEEIEKKFFEYNLSGNIYRTRGGLRLILTDQVRDITNLEEKPKLMKLMTDLFMDNGLMYGYRVENNSRDSLKGYFARLTPKIKNLSKTIEKDLNKVLYSLEAFKLSEMRILNNIKPIKYDFEKLHYETENTNPDIDESFEILRSLIFKYLESEEYSVCKLVKSIKYGGEIKELKSFVDGHDKWTKSNLLNATLI